MSKISQFNFYISCCELPWIISLLTAGILSMLFKFDVLSLTYSMYIVVYLCLTVGAQIMGFIIYILCGRSYTIGKICEAIHRRSILLVGISAYIAFCLFFVPNKVEPNTEKIVSLMTVVWTIFSISLAICVLWFNVVNKLVKMLMSQIEDKNNKAGSGYYKYIISAVILSVLLIFMTAMNVIIASMCVYVENSVEKLRTQAFVIVSLVSSIVLMLTLLVGCLTYLCVKSLKIEVYSKSKDL